MVGKKELKQHCQTFLEAGYMLGFVVGVISVGIVWLGPQRWLGPQLWLGPTWVIGVAIAITMGLVMKYKSKAIVEEVVEEGDEVAGEKAKGQWEE